ncbi:MAG TPA: alginate export family protein, partial [Tepidisphaeraceae bacterium]|nr:alginate export family protein [Tepidisphaeraceae bacterium]
ALDRFNRQLQQIQNQQLTETAQTESIGQRILYDYGGYYNPAYLTLDDQNNNDHILRQQNLAIYGDLNLDGAQELYARGLFVRQDFGAGDAFTDRGNLEYETLDQLYYRFDLQKALEAYDGKVISDDFVFQGGRQLIDWGSGLVLNENLDGARAGASIGPWDVTGLVGLTPVRTVDFDDTRPQFDTHTRRLFYGVMAAEQLGAIRPYVYFLRQEDHNPTEPSVTGDITTRFHYTSNYLGAGATGNVGDKLSYTAELVYEGGRSLSNSFSTAGGVLSPVPQRLDSIWAYGADIRADYNFADVQHSRIGSEVIITSGDKDRLTTSGTFGGNLPGTHDTAFNAFGLLDNGLAFNPQLSNIMALRIGGATMPWAGSQPFDQLQVGDDVFVYGKTTNGAPIDEPTKSSGQYLGVEDDVYMNWQIASDVTLAARYGVFVPDSRAFFSTVARQFFYTGVTFSF